MANEITVLSSLQIRAGNVIRQPGNSQFQADMTGRKGPTPGAVTVSVYGTDVDLSELTDPGWCQITNLDQTADNYCEVGTWDPESLKFYPFLIVRPGKWIVQELSPNLFQEFGTGTGTGTTGPATNRLRARMALQAGAVAFEAYER